jgi:hypothetical protein
MIGYYEALALKARGVQFDILVNAKTKRRMLK